jgi:hypothetical protein
MPLCPQITNTPITVTQTADFTVSSVLPVVAATTTQVDNVVVLLDGKTKAYYQTTAPSTGLNQGDIWFDTDDGYKQYYYTGSAWTSVQDTAIAAAQSAATAAQTTADGKNKVYRQGTTPTGTFSVGDLWFNTSNDNSISRWDGSSWVANTLGNNALASISANKITAGTIDASVITVSNINAGNISTGTLAAARIATGSLDANKLTAGTILASNIATGTITATQIAAGTILASNIATGTITATQIAAGTITSANLATGTLSASNITTGTLSASVGLTATTGTIGGFTINPSSLSGAGGFSLTSSGQIDGGNSNTIFYGYANIGGGTAGSERLIVTGNSNFNGTFIVSGTGTVQGVFTALDAGVNTNTNTPNAWLSTGGVLRRSTASSIRYKENVTDIANVPELDPKKLLDLPVRAFTYKEDYLTATDDRYQQLFPGFISEEVDATYPMAVDYENGQIESWNDRLLLPGMLALIQDLYKEIEVLKAQITSLNS